MLDYEQAGVSVKKADALTELIKQDVKSDNIGMFAGLYEHPAFPERMLTKCRKPGHAQEVPETIIDGGSASPGSTTRPRTLLRTSLLSVHRTAKPILAIS